MRQIFDNLRKQTTKLKDEAVNEQRKSYKNNEVENYYYAMGKGMAYSNVLKNIDDEEEKYLEKYFEALREQCRNYKTGMKEIFNDIRKKVSTSSDEACFMPDDMMVVSESQLKKILDEAETKWEEDCCTQWDLKENATFMMVHGTSHLVDEVKYWKFCPYCGKSIKITEVE